MESPTALRSLVHAYLLGDREPVLDRRWKYKDDYYPVVDQKKHRKENKSGWPWVEKALVPRGAMDALMRRAQRQGTHRPTILRGLVLEALAGRFTDVLAVSASAMFDDPDRYWIPPERATED
jgi:hypothetical protein